MMETTGFVFGAMELVLLLFSGQFLGLVPGERDPLLIKSPPQHAYFYQEWTACGEGVEGSPGIEGFVADPEVQAFLSAVQQSWSPAEADPFAGATEPELLADREAPALLLLATRHSGAVYFAPSAVAVEDAPWSRIEAGVILHLGDEADEFIAILNRLLQRMPGYQPTDQPDRHPIPTPVQPLMLHQDGDRLIVTTSLAALDGLLHRWRQPEAELSQLPEFAEAWQAATLEKFGGLCWINAVSLRRDLQQKFGLPGSIIHNVAQSLGLSSIQSALTVSGIDRHDQVCRTKIALNGDRAGLLKLFSGRPLTASDFAHVPADADFVAATSLNLELVREVVYEIVAKSLPEATAGVREFQIQLENELDLKLEDLVAGFGDVWTVHDSPANGGLILAGLVAGVPVRDKPRAERVVSRVKDLLIESLPQDADGYRARLEEYAFQGTTIYSLQPPAFGDDDGARPVMPVAFCLTDSHLWLALHPQALKAQLRFLASNDPRFDAASKLPLPEKSTELLAAVYLDTPNIGRAVYPLIPYLARSTLGATPGIESGVLPSARAVLPYLQESTLVVARDAEALMMESKNALPIMLALALAPHVGMHFGGHGDVMLLEGRNEQPGLGPAVELGAAEGDIVQANSEEPTKPESQEPSAIEKAARRALPHFLKGAIPDEVEVFIPPVVFERLAEPADPETAAERAAERQRRREERARRRAVRRGLAP